MERKLRDLPAPQGLYDPAFEHDACGIGFVVNIKGEKSYSIIDDALKILENLSFWHLGLPLRRSGHSSGLNSISKPAADCSWNRARGPRTRIPDL